MDDDGGVRAALEKVTRVEARRSKPDLAACRRLWESGGAGAGPTDKLTEAVAHAASPEAGDGALTRLARELRALARPQPPVQPSDRKLCPKVVRGELPRIDTLSPAQKLPGQLMKPGGLVRLLVDMSPGAGKTCIILDVASNFLGEGWTAIVVGDQDTRIGLSEGLRQCPAVARFVARVGGREMDEGPTLLRDINDYYPSSDRDRRFCGTLGDVHAELLGPGRYDCPDVPGRPPVRRWAHAKFLSLTYVEAGNLVSAWADGPPASGRYRSLDPRSPKIVWLLDEAHRLINVAEEPSTWKRSILTLADFFGSLGAEPLEEGSATLGPAVVFLSASPNVTTNPQQTIQLVTALWGKANPNVFEAGDASKPLLVPAEGFNDPANGFVRELRELEVVEGRPRVAAAEVARLLTEDMHKWKNANGACLRHASRFALES